jgi:hypothetical protein
MAAVSAIHRAFIGAENARKTGRKTASIQKPPQKIFCGFEGTTGPFNARLRH